MGAAGIRTGKGGLVSRLSKLHLVAKNSAFCGGGNPGGSGSGLISPRDGLRSFRGSWKLDLDHSWVHPSQELSFSQGLNPTCCCSAPTMKAFRGVGKQSWCNKGKKCREFWLDGKAGAPGSVRSICPSFYRLLLAHVGHCYLSPVRGNEGGYNSR